MIIDIHAHISVEGSTYMPIENQLYGMETYGIDYALISVVSRNEGPNRQDPELPYQMIDNMYGIKVARTYQDKLGVMLWLRPNVEGYSEEFEDMYLQNRDIVKGLKVHPAISSMCFNDPKMEPYLKMAGKYDLPVLIHTKQENHSKVSLVAEMAKKYTDVKFVLGHMSLANDKAETFQIMQEYPNIYGDTAWVYYKDVCRACELGLEDRICFGTDSPVSGKDTYADAEFYPEYYENPTLSKEVWEKIMFRNAQKLFKLG